MLRDYFSISPNSTENLHDISQIVRFEALINLNNWSQKRARFIKAQAITQLASVRAAFPFLSKTWQILPCERNDSPTLLLYIYNIL